MGLDCTVYETIAPLEPHEFTDDCWGSHLPFRSSTFPVSERGLKVGCYTVAGESFSWRAGSYSGYNEWRDWLSERMLEVSAVIVWQNLREYTEQPFFELINFSDCEGMIGPDACAKLAADFEAHKDKVTEDDGWFGEKYETWSKAFHLAAGSGCVDFH